MRVGGDVSSAHYFPIQSVRLVTFHLFPCKLTIIAPFDFLIFDFLILIFSAGVYGRGRATCQEGVLTCRCQSTVNYSYCVSMCVCASKMCAVHRTGNLTNIGIRR